MNPNTARYVIITSYFAGEKYLPLYSWALHFVWRRLPRRIREQLWVVVVANDASAHGERRLAAAVAGIPNEVLCVPRESIYASWNRGVKLLPDAAAFTFWNVDDIRFAKSLTEMFEICAAADGGAVPRLAICPYLEFTCCRCPWAWRWRYRRPRWDNMSPFFCVSRAALERVGLFDETFRIMGDSEWYARYLECGLQPTFTRRLGGIFIAHGGSLSARWWTDEAIAENQLIESLHPGFRRTPLSVYQRLRAGHRPPPRLG